MSEVIICKGADNILREYIFTEEINTDMGSTDYRVYVPGYFHGDFFELCLFQVEKDTYQVMMINNAGQECYSKKGIGESLIAHLAVTRKIKINSSPTMSECFNYCRTNAATKVWQRLVSQGLAKYDEKNDIYYTI